MIDTANSVVLSGGTCFRRKIDEPLGRFMFLIRFIIIVVFVLFYSLDIYPQQKIQDFYLSNYKEGGSKKWEVKGKEAVVSGNYVDIDDMKAKYFQDNDTVNIRSDKAKLDKKNMDVCLKDNVYVNSEKGITLHADALNWKQSSNNISTNTRVNIEKEKSIKVDAKGMDANTALSKAKFKKDVKVDLFRKDDVIKINCDGPLEINYDKGVAVFNNNVVVDNVQGKMFAHKVTVYFSSEDKTIAKVIAEGDVKVVRDDNVTFADRAVYSEKKKKIVLEGRPRLVIFPKEKSKMFNIEK